MTIAFLTPLDLLGIQYGLDSKDTRAVVHTQEIGPKSLGISGEEVLNNSLRRPLLVKFGTILKLCEPVVT